MEVKDSVILIDNMLNKDQLDLIRSEIAKHSDKIEARGFMFRSYVDTWETDRSKSYICSLVDKLLFTKEMRVRYNNIHDLSYQLVDKSSNHEVQFTSYVTGNHYNWHRDDCGDDKYNEWSGRILNYIFYISDNRNFTGGELELSHDVIGSDIKGMPANIWPKTGMVVEPIEGRFVIMPSHVWHRVNRVNCLKTNDWMNGRMTINGHIGFRFG